MSRPALILGFRSGPLSQQTTNPTRRNKNSLQSRAKERLDTRELAIHRSALTHSCFSYEFSLSILYAPRLLWKHGNQIEK